MVGSGLVVPSILDAPPVLISKERSLAMREAIDPSLRQHLTESKVEFQQIYVRNGLPVPATSGCIGHVVAHDAAGVPNEPSAAWASYLSSRLPVHLIVEDREGAGPRVPGLPGNTASMCS